jgi:hypothetical protein
MAKSGAILPTDFYDAKTVQKKSRFVSGSEVNREASNRVAGATRDPDDWITGSYPA